MSDPRVCLLGYDPATSKPLLLPTGNWNTEMSSLSTLCIVSCAANRQRYSFDQHLLCCFEVCGNQYVAGMFAFADISWGTSHSEASKVKCRSVCAKGAHL